MPLRPAMFKTSSRGFTIGELLLVLVMVSALAGFAIFSLVRAHRASYRKTSAMELAEIMQKARFDSMRRTAKNVAQMAQVNILNRKSYSILFDGGYDGFLDPALVMNLPEEPGVAFNGPFPRTYIFDYQGFTVDADNQRLAAPPVTIGTSSGASIIKFSGDGKIAVVPAAKLPTAR